MIHSSSPARSQHAATYVLAGGLLAGLLGKASFEGGTRTAALGLALHYFNATTMSVVSYVAAGRYDLLRRQPLLAGAGYGLLLYGVMNHIVVPLSAAGSGEADPLPQRAGTPVT